MKFALTKIAAGVAMVVAASSAQAVLTSANTLSIQNDTVTTNLGTALSPNWSVSSNGPLVDSFFTMGGVKTKSTLFDAICLYVQRCQPDPDWRYSG